MNEGDVYDLVYDSTRQIYLAGATELNTDEGLKSSRFENYQCFISRPCSRASPVLCV